MVLIFQLSHNYTAVDMFFTVKRNFLWRQGARVNGNSRRQGMIGERVDLRLNRSQSQDTVQP